MRHVLVVDRDVSTCDYIARGLRGWPGTQFVCTTSVLVGSWRARQRTFDLAIIDAALPRWSGFIISELAAVNRTPTLLLSGHPANERQLKRFGYPYLRKPFSITELLAASREAVAETQENISRVAASTKRLKASSKALADTIEISRRLIAVSEASVAGGHSPQ